MNYKSSNLIRVFLLCAVITWTITGCGGGVKKEEQVTRTTVTYENLPPGALPDVPAELGGEGFTGEGWLSNDDYIPSGDPRGKVGGSITWAIYEFPSTLRTDGKDANNSFVRLIGDMVYQSLMGVHNTTLEFVPNLATHWKVSDDFQTYWFRINPNARFSDGSRLTSEDVIATWKLRVDPGILAPYTNMIWSKYEEPVAESPYIVRAHAKELNWKFFLYFGGMTILPAKYIGSILFYNRDIMEPADLALRIQKAADPLSEYVKDKIPAEKTQLFEDWDGTTEPSYDVRSVLLDGFNRAMQGELIYNAERFVNLDTTGELFDEIKSNPEGFELVRLNKKLLEYAYPDNFTESKSPSVMTGSDYMKLYQFKMPPGTNQYILEEKDIKKGRSLTIRRRDDYWDEDNPKDKGTGNFERLKFSVVNDERLSFEKFKKGEYDFYLVGRAQWWKEECDFENIRRGLVQKRKIFNDEPQGVTGFAFNMRVPPFNDKRMRQAFTCLFNREKLITQLFFNEYIHTDSYYPGSVYENPNNPQYRFDPEKAVELLSECGWKERNNEGWLVNDKGEMLELTTSYNATSFERILTVYQEDLAKVGIKLNLKQSQGSTLFKMVNERKFTIYFMSWSGLLFPNPENDVSSWTADPENTNNLSGIKNARIDELINEYNVCFDQQKRVEMIREIDSILMQEQTFALGWFAPNQRILYWNRFGHPDFYLSRYGDWRSIISYWWVDEEKEAKLKEAKKDKSIQLEVGPVQIRYWEEYTKEHGAGGELKGM